MMPFAGKCESLLASLENSLPPQLIDTACVPAIELATSTAANRFAKLFVAASTNTILAFGAIACAHSISSAASWFHPQFPRGFEPVAYTTWKTVFDAASAFVEGSVGRPNVLENTLKSCSAVG